MIAIFAEVNAHYFLAMLPPPDLSSRVVAIQKEIEKKYHRPAALRIVPHITLIIPFHCEQSSEKELVEKIAALALGQQSFVIHLRGFGHFRKEVIFIRPESEPAESLGQLFEKVFAFMQKEFPFITDLRKQETYSPHITVASGDLRKVFQAAWSEYQDQEFRASFEAEAMTLMKHDGKKWNVLHRFPFAG